MFFLSLHYASSYGAHFVWDSDKLSIFVGSCLRCEYTQRIDCSVCCCLCTGKSSQNCPVCTIPPQNRLSSEHPPHSSLHLFTCKHERSKNSAPTVLTPVNQARLFLSLLKGQVNVFFLLVQLLSRKSSGRKDRHLSNSKCHKSAQS